MSKNIFVLRIIMSHNSKRKATQTQQQQQQDDEPAAVRQVRKARRVAKAAAAQPEAAEGRDFVLHSRDSKRKEEVLGLGPFLNLIENFNSMSPEAQKRFMADKCASHSLLDQMCEILKETNLQGKEKRGPSGSKKRKSASSGNCSMCFSPNTNMSNCPLNPLAARKSHSKHPLAADHHLRLAADRQMDQLYD
jgi:hypothetical protein